jgi:hypothetical protein
MKMKIKYLNEENLVYALRKKENEAFKYLLKNYGSNILRLNFSILIDESFTGGALNESKN